MAATAAAAQTNSVPDEANQPEELVETQPLEKQQITDHLEKHLARRPDKVELVRANILPDSTAAPALQRQQKELEKQMLADALEKRLQARPERGALARYLQDEKEVSDA